VFTMAFADGFRQCLSHGLLVYPSPRSAVRQHWVLTMIVYGFSYLWRFAKILAVSTTHSNYSLISSNLLPRHSFKS
jgi:hypothetical protein